jgi:hypothetical protein
MAQKRKAKKTAQVEYRHILISELTWNFSYSFLSAEDCLTGLPYTVITVLSAEGKAVRGDMAGIGKVKLSFYPKELRKPVGQETAAVGVAYQKPDFTDFIIFLPTADFSSILPLTQAGWMKYVDVVFAPFKRKIAIAHSVGFKSFIADDDW